MTIQDLKDKGLILFECIHGSRAYGLATKDSDTDIKGVFYLPKTDFYGFSEVTQVANESNDIVYYELGRYLDLLSKNNPNIMDMLNAPEDCILYKHPLMDLIKADTFLSKLCAETYGNYALSQIKKAKGLKKKIVNPVDKERKGVLDFCYVVKGQGSISIHQFLEENSLDQSDCGLSKIPHMHETYSLYYSKSEPFKGIVHKSTANEVSLSSIPKNMEPVATMSFNLSGYSAYCKEYKEYWAWVEKRNDKRYENTMSHGKNYDAKNMMHTMRLLNMAEEIGKYGELNVKRPDRDYLLDIKFGKYEYNDLVKTAEEKSKQINQIFEDSPLPDAPDRSLVEQLLIQMREELY